MASLLLYLSFGITILHGCKKREYLHYQMTVFCSLLPLCVCVVCVYVCVCVCVCVRPGTLLYIYGDDLSCDPSAALYIIPRYFSSYLDRICPLCSSCVFIRIFCVLVSPPFPLPPSN